MVFDKIVNKLLKKKWNIIYIDELKLMINNFFGDTASEWKIYKTIYKIKIYWNLVNIRKGLFYIKDSDDDISENEIIEKFYRKILSKHCKNLIGIKWYIWWIKALEFNMGNYSIPDEVIIINENKQSVEKIMFEKEALIKKYSSKNKSEFNFFKKYCLKDKVEGVAFMYSNIELSILEALYNPSIINRQYNESMIKKVLKKYKKELNYKIWEEILKWWKHNSSLNRLYQIAKSLDEGIAENIKNIIKRYGYFVTC